MDEGQFVAKILIDLMSKATDSAERRSVEDGMALSLLEY